MLTTETKESIRFYLRNLSIRLSNGIRESGDAVTSRMLREVECLIRVVDDDISKDREGPK